LDAAGFDLTLTGFDLGEIAALTLDETEGLIDHEPRTTDGMIAFAAKGVPTTQPRKKETIL